MTGQDKLPYCCASCGVAGVDDIELKECDNCDLVRYCSDACRELHRPEHAGKCRKRAAELRDEILFKQPGSNHFGDCPICCLPLSIDNTKSSLVGCCSKIICNGCRYANQRRAMELRIENTCPFCREPVPKTEEEYGKRLIKRIEANDPAAMCEEGGEQHEKGNYSEAVEYFTKAAELGDIEAHHRLAWLYSNGEGVEEDLGKEIYLYEQAAIGGHPYARYNLGNYEWRLKGNAERAVKHWIISATQGEDKSIKELMEMFKGGHLSKDDLAASLRAHKAAVDATKSPQRKEAEVFYKIMHSIS